MFFSILRLVDDLGLLWNVSRARRLEISVFCVGYSRIEKGYLRNLESISLKTGTIFAEAPHFREIVELFKVAMGWKRKKEG